MDSDVVLNAIFDTYKNEEIIREKTLQESLNKPPVCKLYQNGKELFDIKNLTINQTRSITPIYRDPWTREVVGNIPGRSTISGEFKVMLVDIKHPFSPEFDYHIELDMLSKTGHNHNMIINHVVFHDSIITDEDVTYQYDAVSLNYEEREL